MSYKNIFFSLTIIALCFATWVGLSYVPKNAPAMQSKSIPDAFMEDATATIMNKQGKVHMKIVAPKMIHYLEKDITELTLPHLTIYRKSPQPWYVNAKFAYAMQGIDNVHFRQDVTVHHAGDMATPATLIKTNSLLVHTNEQTAETSEPITLTQPGLIVKSIGMLANLDTGNIKLLSKARGEYVPN
jgi:lipopolysaccharide export system protein LptC